jgi:hypothetical protein
MKANLSGESVVVAAKQQVSCDLQGEAAILNIQNGTYYGLDSIGTHVWTLIQQPRRVREIRDSVIQEYEVDADRCQNDVLILLRRLLAEGLIEVRDVSAS